MDGVGVASKFTASPLRFLAASSRRGAALLAAGVFGGLLVPPLAHAMRWFIAPNVVLMMTLVLLRVDMAAAFGHLRRPARLTAIVGFMLLVSPVATWALVRPAGLDAGIAAGAVICATGCAATSAAAFARLVDLDPELSLIGTLLSTLLVPLTGPPVAFALTGVDLALTLAGFMSRLALVVGLPLCLSLVIRRLAGPARLAPLGPAVDGALVWLVVLYGFAVMDGVGARLLADPAWVVQATLVAFAVNFGLNALTALAFAASGRRIAATAGLMSGNRNMALYLAVLPAAADTRIALFFAICQFPLFLSPFLLRPVYVRLLAVRA
ncbi:MAG: hypothetical protein JOY70_05195 [Acidisphaera sp.]|nr:hypothetical protein [Acidisphaera sp.]MBV9813992.1 hypothetical protein [Acetobacteraceae bacterium]